jgi:hypothetical protein
MKVNECEKCEYYKRMKWIQSYKPNDYHTIGMVHAYGYCKLYEDRCGNIKKCEVKDD